MEKDKILVIEDDKDLQSIICRFLEKEGYELVSAMDGAEGVRIAKQENPTLILLDLMLPEMDGFEVCRNIRMHSVAPIMIVSAKNSEMDKMLSLGIGADDYVEKPFSLPELEARIRSHIRRYTSFSKSKEQESETKVFGEIEINALSYQVVIKGEKVDLSTKEFQLLDYFASHPAHVFTKEQLLDAVWGDSEFIDLNTITVYVGRIREKMTKAGACYIKTVWGAGYKWEM